MIEFHTVIFSALSSFSSRVKFHTGIFVRCHLFFHMHCHFFCVVIFFCVAFFSSRVKFHTVIFSGLSFVLSRLKFHTSFRLQIKTTVCQQAKMSEERVRNNSNLCFIVFKGVYFKVYSYHVYGHGCLSLIIYAIVFVVFWVLLG